MKVPFALGAARDAATRAFGSLEAMLISVRILTSAKTARRRRSNSRRREWAHVNLLERPISYSLVYVESLYSIGTWKEDTPD